LSVSTLGAASAALHIRPISVAETDYELLCDVRNRVFPDSPTTVAQTRYYDEVRPEALLHQRFEVTRAGEVVAFAAVWEDDWVLEAGRVHFDWWALDPADETAICDAALAWSEDQGKTIITYSTRENYAHRVALIQERGFSQCLRAPISMLDVGGFEPEPWQPVLEKVRGAGVEIFSGVQLAERFPDWQHKLYVLCGHAEEDMPRPEGSPFTWPAFAQWLRYIEGPNWLLGGLFVAVDGDQFVGVTALARQPAKPERLSTTISGVERSHRRRGICTALKLHAIGFARSYGAEEIITDNEENNPMFGINLRLGFTARPAYLIFDRRR
jgi:GNAT superfamily N-acetyltransferase